MCGWDWTGDGSTDINPLIDLNSLTIKFRKQYEIIENNLWMNYKIRNNNNSNFRTKSEMLDARDEHEIITQRDFKL